MPALTLSASPAARRPAARPSLLRMSLLRTSLLRTSLLRTWLNRIRTRRALAALHPDQARDAGLEPWDLRAEVAKPFWRA
ncbi:DUF1127 domain-containing protein [Methylobacterium phyllosphaerae]